MPSTRNRSINYYTDFYIWAASGPQADTGYWVDEDIGAYTPSYDSGYETIDNTYSGDDIGSDFSSDGWW